MPFEIKKDSHVSTVNWNFFWRNERVRLQNVKRTCNDDHFTVELSHFEGRLMQIELGLERAQNIVNYDFSLVPFIPTLKAQQTLTPTRDHGLATNYRDAFRRATALYLHVKLVSVDTFVIGSRVPACTRATHKVEVIAAVYSKSPIIQGHSRLFEKYWRSHIFV